MIVSHIEHASLISLTVSPFEHSRDDKRYTEKKNKSERQRRKKEYVARLRLRVDLALSLDPRIKKFKQEEKAARDEKEEGIRSMGKKDDAKKAWFENTSGKPDDLGAFLLDAKVISPRLSGLIGDR